MGMKWQALVVGALVCSLVSAQVPAVPPGGVKPVPKKSTKPVKDERARVLEGAGAAPSAARARRGSAGYVSL